VHLHLRESLLYCSLRVLKRLDRRDSAATAFDPERVRNILVISSTALGDSVLSTAGFGAVRRRYPHARIVGLIHQAYAGLFSRHPDLDEVVGYRGGYRDFFGTIRRLRRYSFDLALIFHGNEPQATPTAYLSGADFIFKLPNNSRFGFLLANQTPVRSWRDFGSALQQRLAVAACGGADIAGARMSLPTPAAARETVAAWLAKAGVAPGAVLIGFQAGASSRGRMWPQSHFAALAQRLEARYPGVRFLLTGSPDEAEACRRLAAAIGPAALSSAGEVSIDCLPVLMTQLRLLVTGDTGALHVAVAVGTPTVSLFAVSDPRASGPAYDADRHTVIQRPCERSVRSKSDDQEGMRRISVDDVATAVEARFDAERDAP